jgi:hypothetical protein
MDFPFPLRHRFKRGDCLRLLESALRASEGKRTPVFDDAMVTVKAAPTKGGWLMSPNDRRGAEATFSRRTID